MAIKIKHRNPKSTDFKSNELIVNTEEGTLFYKDSKNNLYKIQGDNLSTSDTEFLPNNFIKGNLFISGSIIPDGSGSHDLGSPESPWRDLHVTSESIKFYDKQGEIGKIQFERNKGIKIKDNLRELSILSASIMVAKDRMFTNEFRAQQIRTIGITGSINGGSF